MNRCFCKSGTCRWYKQWCAMATVSRVKIVKIDNDYHHPLRDWKEMFCVGNETDFLLYLHLATGQIAQTHHEDFGSDVDYSGSAIPRSYFGWGGDYFKKERKRVYLKMIYLNTNATATLWECAHPQQVDQYVPVSPFFMINRQDFDFRNNFVFKT